MIVEFDEVKGLVRIDGETCWFMQREVVRGEGPVYYMEQHLRASKLPSRFVTAAKEAYGERNRAETKRGCLAAMKHVYRAVYAMAALSK